MASLKWKNSVIPIRVTVIIRICADYPNWVNYRNKTIDSPDYQKSPTLASHYTIKVGGWARLPSSWTTVTPNRSRIDDWPEPERQGPFGPLAKAEVLVKAMRLSFSWRWFHMSERWLMDLDLYFNFVIK